MDAVVPELGRGRGQVRSQLGGVHLTEELHVGLGENFEEDLELDVEDGHLLQFSESDLAGVEINSCHHGTLKEDEDLVVE